MKRPSTSTWLAGVLFATLLLTPTVNAAIPIKTPEYAVILDGGSSHTTVYVYQWALPKTNGTGLVEQKGTKECPEAVLSKFTANPGAAGASLKDCLDFAAEQVPQNQHNFTTVRLGATAGMRLVALDNPNTATQILDSVRNYVKTNYKLVMDPKEIDLLSPEKEGGYAWTSINFVEEVFHKNAKLEATKRETTWGSLDVGGASAQFAMEAPSANTSPKFSIDTFRHSYKLMTWSFLCYGADEAYRRYRGLLIANQGLKNVTEDPCLPKETAEFNVTYAEMFDSPCSRLAVADDKKRDHYYFHGSGNEVQCRTDTKKVFQFYANHTVSECPFQDPECSFKAIKQRIRSAVPQGKFLAKGSLFYVANDLRTVSKNSFEINPFDASGYETARAAQCARTMPEINTLLTENPKMKLEFVLRMCFSATYNKQLLEEIYGFKPDVMKEMLFANKVKDKNVGWSLGWAVVAASDPLPGPPTIPSTIPQSSASAILASHLITLLIATINLAH